MRQRSLFPFLFACVLSLSFLTVPPDIQTQEKDLEAEFFAGQSAMEEEYRDFEREAFDQFRRDVEAMWNDFTVSTKKDWVEYSGDKTGRSVVDFESGQATVEVLVPVEEARGDPDAVRKRLEQELERLVVDQGKARDYDLPAKDLPVEEAALAALQQERTPEPVTRPGAVKPPTPPERKKGEEPAASRPPYTPDLQARMERMEKEFAFSEPTQTPGPVPKKDTVPVPAPLKATPPGKTPAADLFTFPEESLEPGPAAKKDTVPAPAPPKATPPGKTPAADLFTFPEESLEPGPVAKKDTVPVPAPPAKKPAAMDVKPQEAAGPAPPRVIPPPPLLSVPVLENQLKDREGKVVREENKQAFSKEVVETQPVKQEVVRTKQGEMVKASVTVPLVPDHLRVRAQRHLNDVQKQAGRFQVDVPLAFAVIHTESYFNPKAKSPVPAFGLMQLVPRSGGRDAYQYVYGKDRILAPDYLYQPDKNIELGCAYLGLLQNRYFGKVKDRQNAQYCAIASYNTGAGNLSRSITGNKQLAPAVEKINTMTPDQLYAHLLRNLPYQETQHYLKKVRERMQLYQEWK